MTQSNNQRPAQPTQRPATGNRVRPQNPQQRSGQMGQRPGQGAIRSGSRTMPQTMQPRAGVRPTNPQMRQQVRPTQTINPAQGQHPVQLGQGQMRPMKNVASYRTPPIQQTRPNDLPLQSNQVTNLNPKSLGIVAVLIFVVGIMLGAVMFGGSSKPVQQGLHGVVKNTDIRSNLPRCGRTDRGQACILYIMNSTRYDQIAESFFEEALRLTEVPIYSISMANPKYAKRRIPPGHFAEIHIPKVR